MSTDTAPVPEGAPVPTNTEDFNCVILQPEDHSAPPAKATNKDNK